MIPDHGNSESFTSAAQRPAHQPNGTSPHTSITTRDYTRHEEIAGFPRRLMTRKKRPYIPKVKGCYQCSQRRIDCDGTKPSCMKCTSRGIACSGFGLRYRFLDGFSRRHRKSVPGATMIVDVPNHGRTHHLPDAFPSSNNESSTPSPSPSSPSSSTSRVPISPSDRLLWSLGDDEVDPNASSSMISNSSCFDESVPTPASAHDGFPPPLTPDEDNNDHGNDSGNDYMAQFQELLEQAEELPDLLPWTTEQPLTLAPAAKLSLMPVDLGMLEPWKEFLLSYFSDNIAPELVVVDDCFNGWRHLLLPVACANEMVMDAVLSVSAFHLTGRAAGQPVADADRLYARAIDQLLSRKDLVEWDTEPRQLVILAIVVLLVAVMVNGLSDFPIVFQMLQSAIDAVGGEEEVVADGGELGGFLLRQIRKMRVYAAPLVSQDAGVYAITHRAKESFSCLDFYHRLYPDHSSTFDLIADLRQQAFAMYLNRVMAGTSGGDGDGDGGGGGGGGSSSWMSSEASYSSHDDLMMEQFCTNLESFPEGSLGEHVLVWPAFIAALECRTFERQASLDKFLQRQYDRNGFTNILRALEILRTIWSWDGADGGAIDWPALLPELRVFIM